MNLRILFMAMVFTILGTHAHAEYPDAVRDRPKILAAARINKVEMSNLRFPLSKQLITAPITAIAAIPELIGYLFGSQEGFVILHTIVFEQGQKTLTCGAAVTYKPDNTSYVSVGNCGVDHVQYFSSDSTLIPTTQVP